MKVIYEPKGRAKEYADLAVNLYNGCSHGCEYCYAPAATRKNREDFYKNPAARKDLISKLLDDLKEMEPTMDDREILMSFSCDPYQMLDLYKGAARQAIECFVAFNKKFSILTKGGKRSERDFDLLAEHSDLCRYGATLVFCNDEHSKQYEPNAAPTSERIESLRKAHELGIRTWVSLEPAWSYADVHDLIIRTAEFVDEYRIGILNYHPHAKEIDWKLFKEEVVELCESLNVNYKLKRDLEVL